MAADQVTDVELAACGHFLYHLPMTIKAWFLEDIPL